ncbi:MAG: PRC-barrel domain-containing protein [Deinococcus sp.]
MFKGKELIGRKVMTLENGEHLDNVHDIIFDQSGNQVIAFLIDEGGWFHAAKVIPFASVRSVGEDALMVSSSADVMSARDDTQISDAISSKSGIVGLNLITSDGKELGRIADVFIDEASGQVVGYEATGGFFSDLSSGRTFVPVPESVIIGEKAAIVPPAVARAMEEQEAGGLQGALQRTGESLQTTAGSVSESVKAGAGNLADATRERQKAFVVGKTASREVSSDDGVVVARQNDVITAAQAEQAEALGLLGSLTAAATGGTVQAAYGSARDSVQQGYGDLANASKERQKGYVVGRIAGSDVVASDGTVIVTQGQTITELHATIADDKGALGSLLGSATGGAVQTVYSAARERVGSLTGGSGLLGRRVMSDVYGPNRSFTAAQG